MKPFFISRIFLCFVILFVALFSGVMTRNPAMAAAPTGKEILLLAEGPDLKFSTVKIEGYTIYSGKPVTWSKSSQKGFSAAYTKNYFWGETFIRIDLTLQDQKAKRSYQDTCLIDVLAQPRKSDYVVIVYNNKGECEGGEAGSAQKPTTAMGRSVTSAFYLVDDMFSDVTMEEWVDMLIFDFNAAQCAIAAGKGAAVGGPVGAAIAVGISNNCSNSGRWLLTKFGTIK